jgi:hypothetical protein
MQTFVQQPYPAQPYTTVQPGYTASPPNYPPTAYPPTAYPPQQYPQQTGYPPQQPGYPPQQVYANPPAYNPQ